MRRKPPKANISSSTKDKIPPVQSAISNEWSFSFKYYNQAEYFGLGSVKSTWFVSLLERLRDICQIDPDRLNNPQNGLRYHKIDWNGKGVVFARQDFTWLDKSILENDEDFPFYQFHVSKAMGRVVGFWNETNQVFYIVILDTMHNLQPSKYNGYAIRTTSILDSQYNSLLRNIEYLKSRSQKCTDCEFATHIQGLPIPATEERNAIICFIDDSYLTELLDKLDKGTILSDILELGLLKS